MKKSFIILAGLLFATQIFAADLYITAPSYSKPKKWSTVLKTLQKNGEEKGINVIDYDSLDLKNSGWNSLDRTLDNLEYKKQRLEESLEIEKRYSGWVTTTYLDGKSTEEQIQDVENEIAQLKERMKNQIDPKNCYPLLSITANEEKSWDQTRISASLKISRDSSTYESYDTIYTSKFENNWTSFLVQYVEAFYPLLDGQKPDDSPSVIDVHPIELDGNVTSGYSISVAPRDDYSFVLRRGNILEDYSATWELKASLTNQVGKANGQANWEPFCTDGKNIAIGNPSHPSVYIFNENSALQGTVQYKYPSSYSLYRFFTSGNPYIVEYNYYGGKHKVYFPQRQTTSSYIEFPIQASSVFGGPDETIWFGSDKGSIYVYNKDSSLKQIIHFPLETGALEKVLDDGTFLVKSDKNLSRHKNNGQLMWQIDLDNAIMNTISAGRNGMYYIFSVTDRTLTRLAEPSANIPPVLALIRDGSSKLKDATLLETAEIYLKSAEAYYEAGSYTSALEYFNLYLQISPADASANNKKVLCEVAINKKTASEKTEKALDLFDEYGEETAKATYQEAMMLLEKIKKQVPWDTEVQEMYADLKNAFSTDGSFVSSEKISLEVMEFELSSLFPALISVYASNPSGFIQVKNNSSSPIKNVSVTAYVRKYMDFPSQGEITPELAAGDDAYLPITTLLNKNVLAINEATPVQMQFTIKWEENGKQCSTVITRPVTIYKKSALTWADTAMVACFVQPNDSAVADFIFKALDNKIDTVLSTNLTKAIQIANAVGSIPLNYVADPVTPVTQVIDNQYAVDTVRFPAETLKLKGGDCDDMTTLFCSLMEGTGINSAVITTPGHIFAAFDTGLAYNSVWETMDSEHMIINVNGKAWIPMETTILAKGFDVAWKTASKEIGSEEYEVTTLSEAWEIYSSVPSDQSKMTLSLNSSELKKMNSENRTTVMDRITDALKNIDLDKMTAKELNMVAKLYHTMNNDAMAIEILSFVTERNTDYEAGFSNLASLYEATGDSRKASEYRQRASSLRASSVAESVDTSRAADSSKMDWTD